MNMKCDVINDLLPLYVDDVLSEESKKLVEEHIADCESCRSTLENMQEEIKLPVNQEVRVDETKSIKNLKKMVSNWKLISAISIVAIMILTFLFMTSKTIEIPYDKEYITFEEKTDGYYINYNQKGAILYSASENEAGEWDIEFSQTLWDKYITPLYKEKSSYWFCEKGTITKLSTRDGVVIWEGDEADKEAFEKMSEEN